MSMSMQAIKKVVNFLDLTLNLGNSSCRPYLQKNNNLCQHTIQSSPIDNQTPAKINTIRIIAVIDKPRNILEFNQTIKGGTKESRI